MEKSQNFNESLKSDVDDTIWPQISHRCAEKYPTACPITKETPAVTTKPAETAAEGAMAAVNRWPIRGFPLFAVHVDNGRMCVPETCFSITFANFAYKTCVFVVHARKFGGILGARVSPTRLCSVSRLSVIGVMAFRALCVWFWSNFGQLTGLSGCRTSWTWTTWSPSATTRRRRLSSAASSRRPRRL